MSGLSEATVFRCATGVTARSAGNDMVIVERAAIAGVAKPAESMEMDACMMISRSVINFSLVTWQTECRLVGRATRGTQG